MAVFILVPFSVLAEEQHETRPTDPSSEIFTGAVVTGSAGISWVGLVRSLSGSLYGEGARIRVLGAYGRYGFVSDNLPNTAEPALFEIMAGYQFRTGPLISKVYFGLHGEQHSLARSDPGNELSKMGYGLKLLNENWLDLPMNSFLNVDASYSTLNSAYFGQLRVGMAHFVPRLSIGPEAQIVGNGEHYQFRFGGFARWKLESGSIEASAGYANDYDKDSTPYLGLSYLQRF